MLNQELDNEIFVQIGQVDIIVEYFKGKKNGVFIEAGAWNGEDLSNTLKLEVDVFSNC